LRAKRGAPEPISPLSTAMLKTAWCLMPVRELSQGRRLLSLSPNTQRSFLNLLNAPYRGKSIV
jgi:hypothetical protein